MKTASDTVLELFGATMLAFATIFIVSVIPAGAWYLFDEELAAITGIPALGELPFWTVWGFTVFVGCYKSARPSSKKLD